MVNYYRSIILIYVAMQLSSFIGIPLTEIVIRFIIGNKEEIPILAIGYWNIFIFSVALIWILILLKNEFNIRNVKIKGNEILTWGLGGVLLAFVAQMIGIQIESYLGIDLGSENTKEILLIIKYVPLLVIVSSIIGPILEEIVFRKIIFGILYQKYNFFIAALISSIIFSLAHFDFEHIILYTLMGLVFSYLYVRTNHIMVPIIAHTMMNTIVVIIQFMYQNDINQMSFNVSIQKLLEVFY